MRSLLSLDFAQRAAVDVVSGRVAPSPRSSRRAVVCALLVSAFSLTLFCSSAFAGREYVPGGSFGSEGSGNGQLKEPHGVAVNDSTEPLVQPAAGDVYVVDSGNNRVEQFSSAGAYVGQFNGSGLLAGEGKAAPTGQFSSPEEIAVDNSGKPLLEDPSVGDVYVADTGHHVIDKFSSTGEYISQLTETTGGTPFGELHGVAVDSSGDLWVYEGEGNVDEFSDTGSLLPKSFNTSLCCGAQPGMAIDSSDNVYVIWVGEDHVFKFDSTTGAQLADFGSEASGLAINPSTDNLLVDKGSSIELYGPFGEPFSTPLQRFPTEGLSGSQGIAVNGAGTVYASQRDSSNVQIFNYILLPDVSTESASVVSETSADVHGTVNPDGEAINECYFEYGTDSSYGQDVPCTQTPAQIGKGTAPVAVSAELAGLQPRSAYHFRLVAANPNGTKRGSDESFYISGYPTVESESLSGIGATGATVGAQINAGGLPTVYRVEYGTSSAYGSDTQDLSVGAPEGAVGARVQLAGLQPGLEYHFRFVASNGLGIQDGADVTFTTAPAVGVSASKLPDGRAYEMVSPVGNATVYVPKPLPEVGTGVVSEDISTSRPYRASADGDRVAYVAEPPSSGGGGAIGVGLGNEYLATRTPDGWTASDIAPLGLTSEYTSLSDDLSTGFLLSNEHLTADAPSNQCNVPYSHNLADDVYTALYTGEKCGGVASFDGGSADSSHIVFDAEAALTSEAVPVAEEGQRNLYELAGGQLRSVNVLPNSEAAPNSTFGGPQPARSAGFGRDLDNVISNDGSRVFWTDLNTGAIYVRKNEAITVPVSAGPAQFWRATPDGRYAFYVEAGKLWRFSVEDGTREDLADGEVQGVLGISEDGSYVYFAANGSLAPGATHRNCQAASERGEVFGGPREEEERHEKEEEERQEAEGRLPPGRGCNLYVLHVGGSPRFIAALSAKDDGMGQGLKIGNPNIEGVLGDWRADVAQLTAEVTPDGHSIVFMSTMPLTGYDSAGPYGTTVHEIFVWDDGSGRLSCVSCSPTGAPVTTDTTYTPLGGTEAYMRRWISDDGSRVFFGTREPLVPQATNGRFNVYEWERDGAGDCDLVNGCIYLLSGGSGTDESYLVDASASGGDVFFTTRDQLVPQDHNENVKLYDARVDGGFQQVSVACTGTGCQGVPPAQPIFATPSSVTFSGVGNFPPPRTVAKAKSKSVKCKRGFVKKHNRCVKKKAKRGKGNAKRSSKRSTRRKK